MTDKLASHSNAPLVSVICVTRNAAAQLPVLLESVRKYKTNDVEFVILDGYSTDETVTYIKANTDIINFWLSEPDKGIYDAMNKAVKHARGQWFIFLGADDFLMDGFAEMLPLLKQPDTIYYGGVIYQGQPFSKTYNAYALTKMNICHQAIFYPRSVFDQYSYDTQYTIWADFHLNIRCWNNPKIKFVHYDHIVSHFSQGGYSATGIDKAYERDKLMLFKKYLGLYTYLRYINRNFGTWNMVKSLFKKTNAQSIIRSSKV